MDTGPSCTATRTRLAFYLAFRMGIEDRISRIRGTEIRIPSVANWHKYRQDTQNTNRREETFPVTENDPLEEIGGRR
jgi:hypothetical protein